MPPVGSACRRRQTCRLCDGRDLSLILELTPTPLANAFVGQDKLEREQPTFPLNVYRCEGCGHVQLLDIVDPALLFSDYVYVSGTSPVFVRHFQDYADDIATRYECPRSSLVIDIGSNDGTLLNCFKSAGFDVLGIEPAREIARAANAAGVATLNAFLTADLAREIRRTRRWGEGEGASIVTANNVLAHVDDLAGFLGAVRELLASDGIFVFEVSYLADVISGTLFDTIYHEHLSYHAVGPLLPFFQRNGMAVIGVQRVSPHGGSIRVVAQRHEGRRPEAPSVDAAITHEMGLGLDRPEFYGDFARRIEAIKQQLSSLLRRLKAENFRIAGYGAPAKATTLMYHFGLGPDLIDFVVDDSPLKQGLFTPGKHIPVVPSRALAEQKPDYLLLLAWNFAESIIDRNRAFRERGGKFIVPLPSVSIA